jgi:hypothetical protein
MTRTLKRFASKCWHIFIFSENNQHLTLRGKSFHVLVLSDSKLFLQSWRAWQALPHCKNNFESEMTRTWKRFASKCCQIFIFSENIQHFTLRGKTFSCSGHFWFKVVFTMLESMTSSSTGQTTRRTTRRPCRKIWVNIFIYNLDTMFTIHVKAHLCQKHWSSIIILSTGG